MEAGLLKKRLIILLIVRWQFVNGGVSLNDVSTNYVFGSSALTVTHASTSVTVTTASQGKWNLL